MEVTVKLINIIISHLNNSAWYSFPFSAVRAENRVSRFRMSLRKIHITAVNVPKCRTIFKRMSGLEITFCIMHRWPELLTGRNSVKPCTIPSIIVFRRFIVLFRKTDNELENRLTIDIQYGIINPIFLSLVL